MLDTIQHMKHTVSTAYADSNLAYGGDNIPEEFGHFMMGLWQGNGSASKIWSIISSVIFLALRAQGFFIHFVNYFTSEIEQLVGFSYVEECKMVQSDDDIEVTHSKIQLAVSEWEDLIRIMGGCLSPDKSARYLVDQKRRRGKRKCTNPG